MPIYDLVCDNGHEQIDIWCPTQEKPECPICGAQTGTLWRSSSNVIGDDIPGGIEIKHGICNDDGTPRRYYSKTEIKEAARRKGLIQKDDKPDRKPNPHRIYFT